MRKGKFESKSGIYSFRYAFSGIISLIKNEHNARIHLIAAFLAVILGIILRLSVTEWLFISLVISLVFITELINSAIEMMADLIDPDVNHEIKQIKDYGAASVLISAIIAVIAGGIIFIPKLLNAFSY